MEEGSGPSQVREPNGPSCPAVLMWGGGQGKAGQDRTGQGRAGQGTAGQGRVG